MRNLSILITTFFLFNSILHASEPKPVLIGFDGAYGLKNSTSAQAIEQGLLIAIEEINQNGGVLKGKSLQLLTKDNRSVPARGIQNVKLFAENKDVVAVIGGRFSPVILSALPIVHEKKIPLIDAWGSADKITDHNFYPSYTFRVSLRDKYAMPTMLRHAQSKGAERIGLLLPNTGWGRSNYRAAKNYLKESKRNIHLKEIWYNWGDQDFSSAYDNLLSWNMDALVMVANDIEGALIVRTIAKLPQSKQVPVISHWGVTGGHFVKACEGSLEKLDFSVVQTFSLFKADEKKLNKVMALAKQMYGIKKISDIKSPVGFGHAYDIVHLLVKAINIAGTTERSEIRNAFEKIIKYKGLVKTYNKPFGPNDHDALELTDVFMATYDKNGVLRPL